MFGVIALSCTLWCSVKYTGTGCEDELAVDRSARGQQGEGRGKSHACGGGVELLAWGADKEWSSVWDEWGRGELVGREWTKDGLPCGTSGTGTSWLGGDEVLFLFFFFFSV
jgi:hypothetical protein